MDEQGGLDQGDIARLSASINRACGECSLCCFLLDVPEAKKQKTQWCPHCKPSKNGGCTIYSGRPPICKAYACMYLVNKSIPDYWYPLTCGMILDHTVRPSGVIMRIHVDPANPNKWRQEPFFSDIKTFAKHGLEQALPRYRYKTAIVIQDVYRHIVLPNKVVKFSPGVALKVGQSDWEYIPAQSDNEAKRMEIDLEKVFRHIATRDDTENDND